MFKDTIDSINHEIEWIDFELTRQSTNSKSEKLLVIKKLALVDIRSACTQYDEGKTGDTPREFDWLIAHLRYTQALCETLINKMSDADKRKVNDLIFSDLTHFSATNLK